MALSSPVYSNFTTPAAAELAGAVTELLEQAAGTMEVVNPPGYTLAWPVFSNFTTAGDNELTGAITEPLETVAGSLGAALPLNLGLSAPVFSDFSTLADNNLDGGIVEPLETIAGAIEGDARPPTYSAPVFSNFTTLLGFGIVSVDSPFAPGQAVTLTVEGLTGTYTVTANGTELTVTDETLDGGGNGTITVTALARGDLRYGELVTLEVEQDAATHSVNIPLAAEPGLAWVNIVDPLPLGTDRVQTTPDLETGFQLAAYGVVGGTIADVTLRADGSFTVDGDVTEFTAIVHDGTEWGAPGVQEISGPANDLVAAVTEPLEVVSGGLEFVGVDPLDVEITGAITEPLETVSGDLESIPAPANVELTATITEPLETATGELEYLATPPASAELTGGVTEPLEGVAGTMQFSALVVPPTWTGPGSLTFRVKLDA